MGIVASGWSRAPGGLTTSAHEWLGGMRCGQRICPWGPSRGVGTHGGCSVGDGALFDLDRLTAVYAGSPTSRRSVFRALHEAHIDARPWLSSSGRILRVGIQAGRPSR
jgi:hypothetical protein